MAVIAFIGLGNMGQPMSRNLLKAGHTVIGYDLVKENCDRLVQAGGRAAESLAQAVAAADIVISMVPTGKHVLAVYEGEFAVAHKDDRSPLTAADLAAHHAIVSATHHVIWNQVPHGTRECDGAPRRGDVDPELGLDRRLLGVIGHQRSTTRMPEQQNVLETAVPEEDLTRGAVQDGLLVHEVDVVVRRSSLLGPHGDTHPQPPRDHRMMSQRLARVHEADDRSRPRQPMEQTGRPRTVECGQLVHRRDDAGWPRGTVDGPSRAKPIHCLSHRGDPHS